MSVSRETVLFGVPRETSDRLDVFVDLLFTWNARVNLIGRGTTDDIWSRHIADSLQLMSFLTHKHTRAIDLGTGAGFPGLILAIVSNLPFDLVESDKRKAAFLQEAIRLTQTAATVHAKRIEDCVLPPSLVITSRALAPLTRLLDYAYKVLAPGGVCLFLKGKTVLSEIQDAERHWTMNLRLTRNQVDASGFIVCISELAHV